MDKKTKERIIIALHEKPHLRDDDNRLIATIWHQETPRHIQTKMDFLGYLASGKLSSPETIRRLRQKIQEETPALRGKKYNERHKHQETVKSELGYGKK